MIPTWLGIILVMMVYFIGMIVGILLGSSHNKDKEESK